MTREDKCKLAIELGYVYYPESGKVTNRFGRQITAKQLGYIKFTLPGKHHLYVHQFAWYFVHKEIVDIIDHIDRDGTNNRIDNLRAASRSENLLNNNAKGYTYDKRIGKWKPQLQINKQKFNLGFYDTPEEARLAYIKAKALYQ